MSNKIVQTHPLSSGGVPTEDWGGGGSPPVAEPACVETPVNIISIIVLLFSWALEPRILDQ